VLSFAPLGGETFLEGVPGHVRATLPDSLVLLTADGRLRVRSAAVVEGLRLAGGAARTLAAVLRRVPTPLADGAYNLVARVRRALFRPPGSACPVVAPSRRARFLP
jgi:predicted DCC family thiol-disulfide oxidoreductase YuxK